MNPTDLAPAGFQSWSLEPPAEEFRGTEWRVGHVRHSEQRGTCSAQGPKTREKVTYSATL